MDFSLSFSLMVGYQSGASQVQTLDLFISHISALTFTDTELSARWDVSLDNNSKANDRFK